MDYVIMIKFFFFFSGGEATIREGAFIRRNYGRSTFQTENDWLVYLVLSRG